MCKSISSGGFACINNSIRMTSCLTCEQQTHFRSSLLFLGKIATLFFGGREATTGNASAVRRLLRVRLSIVYSRDSVHMLRSFCKYIGKYCEVIRGSFNISEQNEMIHATILNKLRE